MTKPTTSCTKPIWIVVYNTDAGLKQTQTQRIAAWDFNDLLTFFNEQAIGKILEVKKLDEEVTYHY
jgi:hypothetical protein